MDLWSMTTRMEQSLLHMLVPSWYVYLLGPFIHMLFVFDQGSSGKLKLFCSIAAYDQ